MVSMEFHPDHDHMHARHQRFVDAWVSHSAERIMEFMDKDDFNYSTFGTSDPGHDPSSSSLPIPNITRF